MLPLSEMGIEDGPFSIYVQISRSLEHFVIVLSLLNSETLHNFPYTTNMGISSEDDFSGLKQFSVYSFGEDIKKKTIPSYGGGCVSVCI